MSFRIVYLFIFNELSEDWIHPGGGRVFIYLSVI